jgi:hypothetical protein
MTGYQIKSILQNKAAISAVYWQKCFAGTAEEKE